MSVLAHCTWGDGPDVLLRLNGSEKFGHFIAYKAGETKVYPRGSIDLSLDDARDLLFSLEKVIKQVEDLEAGLEIYMKKVKDPRT